MSEKDWPGITKFPNSNFGNKIESLYQQAKAKDLLLFMFVSVLTIFSCLIFILGFLKDNPFFMLLPLALIIISTIIALNQYKRVDKLKKTYSAKTALMKRYFNTYMVCPYSDCNKSIEIVGNWTCDYCHNKQIKAKAISEPCGHCGRKLKTAMCEFCGREFVL